MGLRRLKSRRAGDEASRPKRPNVPADAPDPAARRMRAGFAGGRRGAADTAAGRQCGGCSGRDTMRRTGRGNERSVDTTGRGGHGGREAMRRMQRTGGNATDDAYARSGAKPVCRYAEAAKSFGGADGPASERTGRRMDEPPDVRTCGHHHRLAGGPGRGGTRGVTIPVCRPAASHRVRCGSGSGGRCGRRSPPRRRRP